MRKFKKAVSMILIVVFIISSFTLINQMEVFAEDTTCFKAVAAGCGYSLALREDGSLWAWGYNGSGQLGDGTTTDKFSPVKIMDEVVAVAAGSYHSLAIKKDGSLWAWGDNFNGQLSDCYIENKNVPVKIMDNVKFIAASLYHSFVVKEDGSLWFFGSGEGLSGVVSNPSKYEYIHVPVKVMEGVKEVATSDEHAVAVKEDGSLWAWGKLSQQVGDVYYMEPIKLMDHVKTAAAGNEMSVAVKEDGTLWVWSDNRYYPMSDGVNYWKSEPVQLLDNVDQVTAVSNNFKMSCAAIKKDGSVWTWKRTNILYNSNDKATYETVKVMEQVKTIALSTHHSLIIKKDGSLWVYGYNYVGEFGNGVNARKLSFNKVMDEVKEIGAIQNKSYAIKKDNSLWFWGNYRSTPIKIMEEVDKVFYGGYDDLCLVLKKDGSLWEWGSNTVKVMENVKSAAVTQDACFALQLDGTLWSWGENRLGFLGDGTKEGRKNPVKIMDSVKEVLADADGSIISAIKEDQTLWQWGRYYENGVSSDHYTPTKIMEDVKYCTGDDTCYAIKNDGSLWGWGSSYSIGNESISDKALPVKIMDKTKLIKNLSSYYTGSQKYAIKEDGSLWYWGGNSKGELNDGTRIDKLIPIKMMEGVKDIIRILIISASGYGNCVLKEDGSLWYWGKGFEAIPGYCSAIDEKTPFKVMEDVKAIAQGEYHSLVLKNDGSVFAWGINEQGQLGNGEVVFSDTPVKIIDGIESKESFDFKVVTAFEPKKLAPKITMNVKVNVENLSENPYEKNKDVLLIVALYDKNNSMINTSYISKEIPYRGIENLSAGFKLPNAIEGLKVRAYVWDGTSIRDSSMIPLSNVEEIQ